MEFWNTGYRNIGILEDSVLGASQARPTPIIPSFLYSNIPIFLPCIALIRFTFGVVRMQELVRGMTEWRAKKLRV
jgi:hypothetical protein